MPRFLSALRGLSPASGAIFAALAFLVLTTLVTAAALERERIQLLDQARHDAGTLAALFDESTARTFDAVDVTLEGLSAYFSARGPLQRHDPAARETMRARLGYMPTVRALFVIGPDGFIQHDTDFPKTPDISLADRDYFRQYVNDAALKKAMSPALQSRSGTGWFVAATRRITAEDGKFLGVVVAAVQLDSISRIFKRLDLPAGHQVWLLRDTGELLASYPGDDRLVGQSYASFPVFNQHLPRARAGLFDMEAGPPLDYPRVVAYRAVQNHPLVVVVTSDKRDVLAPWRRTVVGSLAALAVLALLTAGIVTFFLRHGRERQRAEAHATNEANLRREAEELSDADRLRNQFLATLSHELRNVLAPVQNCVQLLNLVDPSSEQGKRARGILARQVQQMRTLIDDLLDISRVNSGKIHLSRRPIDLHDLLSQAAHNARTFMEKPGHLFEVELTDEALPVEGDSGRLLQVFANLLGNAAKYTPPAGQIRLRARREGREAVVEVIDNGLGIPAEAQATIFDMFEQVRDHADSREGGLGIGLALVQKLVALHGGRVEVESEGVGHGSKFTVHLPLEEPAAAAQRPTEAAPEAVMPPVNTR